MNRMRERENERTNVIFLKVIGNINHLKSPFKTCTLITFRLVSIMFSAFYCFRIRSLFGSSPLLRPLHFPVLPKPLVRTLSLIHSFECFCSILSLPLSHCVTSSILVTRLVLILHPPLELFYFNNFLLLLSLSLSLFVSFFLSPLLFPAVKRVAQVL